MIRSGRRSLPRRTTMTWPRVIRGVYGNGNERRQALGGAYDTVMAIVNQRLGGSAGTVSNTSNCGSVCVTVRSGDTLSSIAASNGGSWNQYTGYRSGNPNVIYAGETVCRRTGTGTVATGGRYVVRSGDTLGGIAAYYGGQHVQHPRIPFRQSGVDLSGRDPLLVRRLIMVPMKSRRLIMTAKSRKRKLARKTSTSCRTRHTRH